MATQETDSGEKILFDDRPNGGFSAEHSDYYSDIPSTDASAQPSLARKLKQLILAMVIGGSTYALADGALKRSNLWEAAGGFAGLMLVGGYLYYRNLVEWADELEAVR
ncbi:MAG: hypothetical protein Q7S44_00725 [bacterium]|nr:hypothetical protein [bacterium]